jgi:hypothetical protein
MTPPTVVLQVARAEEFMRRLEEEGINYERSAMNPVQGGYEIGSFSDPVRAIEIFEEVTRDMP